MPFEKDPVVHFFGSNARYVLTAADVAAIKAARTGDGPNYEPRTDQPYAIITTKLEYTDQHDLDTHRYDGLVILEEGETYYVKNRPFGRPTVPDGKGGDRPLRVNDVPGKVFDDNVHLFTILTD